MISSGRASEARVFSSRAPTGTVSFFIVTAPASSRDSFSSELTSHSIRCNWARIRSRKKALFSSAGFSESRSLNMESEVRGVLSWCEISARESARRVLSCCSVSACSLSSVVIL